MDIPEYDPKMETLNEALLKIATELEPVNHLWPTNLAPHLYYCYCHAPRPAKNGHDPIPAPSKQTLINALETSTDEDRLYYAEKYAKEVLALTNLEDAIYFRNGVLRKETSALIKYQKHRDHSVHTLHNYMLGWYMFSYSDQIRRELKVAIQKRKGTQKKSGFEIRRFAELWCYVSLLHDVGYIFEGVIEEEQIALTDDMVRKGADYALDYFADVFWKDLDLRTADFRRIGQELLNIRLDPDEGRGGPGTIAYFLRNLGDLKALTSGVGFKKGLPSDAFSLWDRHYEEFGNLKIQQKIKLLEPIFYEVMERPTAKAPRHLDHGVCGGLLLLKYSTWWFRAVFEAKGATPEPHTDQAEVAERVTKAVSSHKYNIKHWWTSIVWATAAVALHNVQQLEAFSERLKPLELADDPLAYLGILVDILQEWDRHSVRRITTIPMARRRINSRDVHIGRNGAGLILIEYYCRDGSANERQKEMETNLDASLADWRSIVKVSFLPQSQSYAQV